VFRKVAAVLCFAGMFVVGAVTVTSLYYRITPNIAWYIAYGSLALAGFVVLYKTRDKQEIEY